MIQCGQCREWRSKIHAVPVSVYYGYSSISTYLLVHLLLDSRSENSSWSKILKGFNIALPLIPCKRESSRCWVDCSSQVEKGPMKQGLLPCGELNPSKQNLTCWILCSVIRRGQICPSETLHHFRYNCSDGSGGWGLGEGAKGTVASPQPTSFVGPFNGRLHKLFTRIGLLQL